jgi:hypothetical protein
MFIITRSNPNNKGKQKCPNTFNNDALSFQPEELLRPLVLPDGSTFDFGEATPEPYQYHNIPSISNETIVSSSIASTISNLGRNITSVTLNNGPKPVSVHNMTSKTSIICNQGPIPVEYIIPLSGNHFSTYTHYKEDTKKRKSLSWIFQYCYGLRPKDADVIYCTFNRTHEDGCHSQFVSKGKTSSSFTKHLKNTHKLDQEARTYSSSFNLHLFSY